MSNPMDVELAFPSKYLAAPDLDGRRVTVKISSVKQDDVVFAGGKKEQRIVVKFEKSEKMWIMNKTNAFSLAVLLWESDMGLFRGKRVTLAGEEDVIKGETVMCVRVVDSPDATPRGKEEFMRCWNAGERKGNKMIERLKATMARVKQEKKTQKKPPPETTSDTPATAPPVEPPAESGGS